MKNKIYILLLLSFFLFGERLNAQGVTTVKLMCWNLLNYPDQSNTSADTTLRHPFYRTVIQYENPDILVTEENTSATATTWFLNTVMNENGVTYSKGTFLNGPDTDNEIYFKSSMFTFVSNVPIVTDLRYISEFKLVHIATGDTIRIYAVHLKASSGPPNDAQRTVEVDSLRSVTNRLPPGSNFVVCGDFNIYGDFESAYQNLLQNNPNDDGDFVDPIHMTGTWHYFPYRQYHTQSTRTTSFGGGATGGLNDRFDMILFSHAIQQGSAGISFVAGSTTPVGNDGNHYNEDINVMPNNAAPSTVINALYHASDHLPVYALFNFSSVTTVRSIDGSPFSLTVFPNPSGKQATLKYKIDQTSRVSVKMIDVLGREVFSLPEQNKPAGEYVVPMTLSDDLERGVYFIYFQVNNAFISTRFIKY